MKRLLIIQVLLLTILSIALAQDASKTSARKQLNESPGHQEWVKVQHDDRLVHAFLVFPERKDKAPSVIVIHENRGLTDWVCSVADKLAEHGYIAIAPDLLSGMGPDGGKTNDFPDQSAAREAIYKLPQEQVTSNLNAVFEYVAKIPAANGTVAVAGFCWGGSQTFLYATEQSDLSAAYVFYGTPPDRKEKVENINCPVYGFYGGNDERVGATIPMITKLMKESGKVYRPIVYENAGHGFMRSGEEPDASEANQNAKDDGWKRWLSLLQEL